MPFIVVLKLPFFCWTCLDGYIIEVEQCKAGKGLPGTTPDIGSCSSESLRYWIPAVSHWWFTDLQPYSTFPLFPAASDSGTLLMSPCSWLCTFWFCSSVSGSLMGPLVLSDEWCSILFSISDPVPLHITDRSLELRPRSCTQVSNERIGLHWFSNTLLKNTTDNLAHSGSPWHIQLFPTLILWDPLPSWQK